MVITGIVMNGVSMAIKELVDDSDSSSDSEELDSDFEYVRPGLSHDTLGILIEHLNQLYAKRYGAPHTRIPKSTHWWDHVAFQEDTTRFKAVFRIDLRTFDILLDLIIDHPIFQNNSRSERNFKALT